MAVELIADTTVEGSQYGKITLFLKGRQTVSLTFGCIPIRMHSTLPNYLSSFASTVSLARASQPEVLTREPHHRSAPDTRRQDMRRVAIVVRFLLGPSP
jgi:hypothetical protein